MQESYEDVVSDLEKEKQGATDEHQLLQKKQKVGDALMQFLEKEVTEAQTHLNDLVRSIERANAHK